MKPMMRTLRWESTADASRCGIEIADLVPGEDHLETELDRILGGLSDFRPAFVLARFKSGQPKQVAAAISGASDLFFDARVCVAVDEQTLSAIDHKKFRRGLGIVLDCVNADTPLSALCDELVEAIRFDPDFVRRASIDLRLSCAIDAMLKLTHDLGLATLASVSTAPEKFSFDYVLRRPEKVATPLASAH